jgi:hypothetical protein
MVLTLNVSPEASINYLIASGVPMIPPSLK